MVEEVKISDYIKGFVDGKEIGHYYGTIDACNKLKDIICQRKCGECEWVTCPFKEVKEHYE